MKIITLNVEGISSNQVYLRKLIKDHRPHIICLQEHWLFNFEKDAIDLIHPDYSYVAKSTDDAEPIPSKQRPRGYGGVATLWHKDLSVTSCSDGSERTLVIQVGDFTVINSYLPCRGGPTIEEFCDEMAQIEEICSKFSPTSTLILAGDLNVDMERHTGTRVTCLKELIQNHSLREFSPIPEPTYIHHSNDAVSKIDYIFTSKPLPEDSSYRRLPLCSSNTSPHCAIILEIAEVQLDQIPRKKPKKTVNQWHKMDEDLYEETIDLYLQDPPDIVDTEAAVKYLVKAIHAATTRAVPTKTIKAPVKPKPFNKAIQSLIAESKRIDWMWKKENCPPSPDPLAVQRYQLRKLLRKAQSVEAAIRRDAEYEDIMNAHQHDDRMFYRLIKKQRQTTQEPISELEVNGTVFKDDLLEAWTSHFSTLAVPGKSPHFDEEFNRQVEADVKAIHTICDRIDSQHIPITMFEISKAIERMKKRKAKDEDNLVAEHLQHGGPNLSRFITNLINRIIETKEIPDAIKGGIMHPIHKKGKPINIAGNHRGISIISIICKVLDLIMLAHQTAAIPDDKCDRQFSFTKGRSPNQATIILSELLAEAKEAKKPLLVATLDIQKAFDVISHPHLLRKLYEGGLPGRWWLLKENSYSNMSSRVIWQNQLGQKFPVYQGNKQGANGSPGDFKEYTDEHHETMAELGLGCHIGSIYVGTLACADDVLLSAWSEMGLAEQLTMMSFFANKDRLTIHPQKTGISVFQISKAELEHLKKKQPWLVNGEGVPVGNEFTHLGVQFNFTTYTSTATATVDNRLKLGRTTTYSLMGAGFHGINGINPTASIHIYKIYVQPRMLYGLEAIDINAPNLERLEVAHRSLIRNIQSLPRRTASASLYILSGILPIEAITDKKRLTLIPSLAKNPTVHDLIFRQIAVKEVTSRSWTVQTQAKLRKYDLDHITDVIRSRLSKEAWKEKVDKAINSHWARKIQQEAAEKSSLKYLNNTFVPNSPHLVWNATSTDPRDVRRAVIKARMLSGSYILQHNRAAFNQTCDRTCPLCDEADEDVPHFLLECSATDHLRKPIINNIIDIIPLVYEDHPSKCWNSQQITQLILDPSHPSVIERLPLSTRELFAIEAKSRSLCFTLHRYRALTLGYRP